MHGDFFRDHADHVFEKGSQLIPERVQEGDIIFVHRKDLPQFFHNFHPQIPYPYILITHKFPSSIPDRFTHYLNDPKLLHWYGTNATAHHPKLSLIPLGIPNPNKWIDLSHFLSDPAPHFFSKPRPLLLYLNFSDETHPSRQELRKQFENTDYCFYAEIKKHGPYLADLAQSKFVLSPPGIGIDCYRTWEAMIQGAIPIVITSPLDPLFEDLPILIVHDWSEISESFLNEKYEEMRGKSYKWEKLHGEYWLGKIRELGSQR